MNPSSLPNSDARPLEGHLRQQLAIPERAFTLDMDDVPERTLLGSAGILEQAVAFLNQELAGPYRAADEAALDHQRKHRRLARIAIVTGMLAIGLAIVQLGLAQTWSGWTRIARWLELIAVAAGVAAVFVGLKAKFDSQWFVQRYVAERLRMLKFQALGQTELWCGKTDAWQTWVRDTARAIQRINSIQQVKQWAAAGEAEPFEPAVPPCEASPEVLRALSDYYQWKRVEFQAAYFGKQAGKYRDQYRPLSHRALPLFLLTIGAVAVHFGADWFAEEATLRFDTSAAHRWHAVGVWALAFAALIPIASLGLRAWLGAFEPARSASLFEAKQHALNSISGQLAHDCGNLGATMHHIAHVEHFLEHEHREWLRLMLETEWFL